MDQDNKSDKEFHMSSQSLKTWIDNWKKTTDSITFKQIEPEVSSSQQSKAIIQARNLKAKLASKNTKDLTLKDQKAKLETMLNNVSSQLRTNPFEKAELEPHIAKMEFELKKIRTEVLKEICNFGKKFLKNSSQHVLVPNPTMRESASKKQSSVTPPPQLFTGFKSKFLKTNLFNKSKDSFSSKFTTMLRNKPQFDEYYGRDSEQTKNHIRHLTNNSNTSTDSNRKGSIEKKIFDYSKRNEISQLNFYSKDKEVRLIKKVESNSALEKLKSNWKTNSTANDPAVNSINSFTRILDKIMANTVYQKESIKGKTCESAGKSESSNTQSKHFSLINNFKKIKEKHQIG